jgi:PTS system nitrogen regulatory IIA component
MEISDFLLPAGAIASMRAPDKNRLLHDLAQRAATMLGLPAEEVSVALLKREELGSTGTGGGVAIPHARLPSVARPFGLLARLDRAIDFDAIDGKKVDIVFLLLLPAAAPKDQKREHGGEPRGGELNALACAARALRDPDVVANVRRAGDNAALYRAVTQAGRAT